MNKSVFSLLVPALLAAAGLAARAQTGVQAKPVTLSVSHAPVRTVLKLLFTSAGIHDFVIAPDVPGEAGVGSLSLTGVPFPVALKQVLGAVSPPLAADLQDGVYHVRASSSVEILADFPAPMEDAGQNRFYKIGVKHYDAGMLADAMTRRGGIILLPPNFVIPANSAAPTALNRLTVTTTGGPSGPGMPVPGVNGPPTGPAAGGQAGNVLPPGVKRIFVLESDNSLVVEATPDGIDNLTGSRLLSGGYTQVY